MFETYLNKLEEKIIHISNTCFQAKIFSFEGVLVAVSYLYGLGVRFRLWLYTKKILKQRVLPCFVISIGNIVAGGTGKTPMAIYVAIQLQKMGKKVVVISRGYKGNYKKESLIVSDGDQIFFNAGVSGDEPYMMAKRKLFSVVVGQNRFKAGIKAVQAFHPDVVVLDDGFQHLNLKRDLDLLLFDYINPLGNGRLLPAGRLREPLRTAMLRVDALILTRSPETKEDAQSIGNVLKQYPGFPWFRTFHRPFIFEQVPIRGCQTNEMEDVSSLKGKSAVLFSAIANNASFFHAMKESGVKVMDHLEFKDHYRYKESDILRINRAAERIGVDIILTTEKDWAKLDATIEWEKNLVVVGIDIQFQDTGKFQAFLNKKLGCHEG